METQEMNASKAKKIGIPKRKAVDFSQGDLVKAELLRPDLSLPLVLQPTSDNVNLFDWATNNRPLIDSHLLKHGALLFRGFALKSAGDFEKACISICPNLYGDYGDLPREGVSGKIYSSTPYPPDKTILFHNESSHLPRWPQKQFFFCLKKSQEGGETPLMDCREICRRLDPELLAKFESRGLMYVRNFLEGVDVSWQNFFHTTDRAVVEENCRQEGMECEWTGENNLRIRQHSRAVIKHPKTGETAFFNQVQLHHVSCLDAATRESLRSIFKEEDLPRNVYYGDGSPIEDEVMDTLNRLYWEIAVSAPWQEGDLIMLDNMLVAHARNPYVGPRKILVAMGDMFSSSDLN